MPRRVNKPAVAIVTLAVMGMTIVAGVLLVKSIPSTDPAPMVRKAQEAIAKGQYRMAVQCYQRAYQRSQDTKYLVLAGDAARDMGESGMAFGLWQNAVMKDPNCMDAREHSLALWIELLEMNEWKLGAEAADRVAADAEALLKSRPNDFVGRFARGVAYINQATQKPEKEKEGLEDLKTAADLRPTDLRVLTVLRDYWVAKGQQDQAEALCKELIRKMPEDPTGYLALGQLRLSQGESEAATEQLQKAVSLGKDLPQAAVALAQAYALKPDYDAADKLLSDTIESHPDHFDAWVARTDLLLRAEKPGEALALAERWLKRPPILVGYKSHRNRLERLQMCGQAASAAIAGASPKEGGSPDDALVKKAQEYVTRMEKEAGQDTPYTELLQGRIYRLEGKIVEATKVLEKADKSFNGTNADVRLRLAELYLMQREMGLTQKMLASVIQMAPKYPRAYYMAALVAAQMGDGAEAMAKLDAGLQLEPDNRDMLQLKVTLLKASDQKAQLPAIEQKLGQPASVAERLQRAYQSIVDGKPQEAEAACRDILASEPGNISALRMLLALLLQRDRQQEAREVYDAARAASPDDSTIRQLEMAFSSGMTAEQREQKTLEIIRAEPDERIRSQQLYAFYMARQQYDEAGKIADQVEQAHPEDERAVTMQFTLALLRQDWVRAQKYADIAARKDLDGADGGFFRARLATARGDLQKGLDELNIALQKYPSFSDGWVQLARIAAGLNRLDDARKSLAKALEINPAKGEAYKVLAQLAAAQGDEAAFEENLGKAVQYLRYDPWVEEQATNLSEKKDPQRAILVRRKMLEADPKDATNLVRLAMLYERQEQYDQAGPLIDQAVKLAPKDASLAWVAATYWQRRQDPAKAQKILLDLAQASDPDQKVSATVLLARLYQMQKLTEKAEQTYNVAVKQAPEMAGPWLELAGFYREAGRIDDAVNAYRQALQVPKNDSRTDNSIRQVLVETLLQSHKLDEASKEIDAFHKAFPDDPGYQLQLGTLLMLQGRTEEAVNTLTTYLHAQPSNAPAHYHRGLIYLATNRLPQAIDDLSQAKQLSPKAFSFEHRKALALAYEANRQPERAVTELNEILRDDPQVAAVARLLADIYLRSGRMNDLEALIRKYMDLMPQDWTWPQMLGRVGEATGNYKTSVEGYSLAARTSHFDVEPVDDLLRTQIASKKYEQAVDYVQKVIPEDGRVAEVKARWAEALWLQGDKDKARTLFGQAIAEASKDYVRSGRVARITMEALGPGEAVVLLKQRISEDPENLLIKYMLVAMLAEQKQWDAADALSGELVAAAKSNTDKIMVLRQRGALLYQEGKHEAASTAYEDLLKLKPDDAEAMNNVAYILAEDLNRPQEALRYARRAVELRARDANLLDTLGWVYYLSGDLDSAVGTLVSALQYSPNNVAARYHVAIVYKRQGKLEQAKRELDQSQQLIEASPQDPVVQMFQDRVKQELSSLSGAAAQ
jgi:tetratricopeptide (TPR) repeat protein